MFKYAHQYSNEILFYFDEEDRKHVARGGSFSWRSNNPGLLRTTDAALYKYPIVGKQSPYSIFSSSVIGSNALIEWLRSFKYFSCPLSSVVSHYAAEWPENGSSRFYEMTNLQANTRVNQLSNHEFCQIVKAIQQLCGFSSHEGSISRLPKIVARYYSKDGKVDRYLEEKGELLTRGEAITWVKEHRLDAVIVHMRNGTTYLRARPGHHFSHIHVFSNDDIPHEELKNAMREVGEKNPKQCIWGFINGIWNDETSALKSASVISEAASGEQVWLLVNDTKTLPVDLIKCGQLKLHFKEKIVQLAAKFFQLLLDLSNQHESNPPIVLFTHSQGAIIAVEALNLLNEAERKNLRIFTFGGGSFVAPNKAHFESHNYISTGDLIPRIGSFQLAKPALRLYELKKRGLSDEQIVDYLVTEDADFYLDAPQAFVRSQFFHERKNFYQEELSKISNVSVIEQSENASLGYWEHSFEQNCYKNKVIEIVHKYHNRGQSDLKVF